MLAVHGSHLTAVFMTLKTRLDGRELLVHVIYDPHHGVTKKAHVSTADAVTGLSVFSLWLNLALDEKLFIIGDVKVALSSAAPVELVVSNPHWEYKIAPATYRLVDGGRRNRVDVSTTPLTDPLGAPAAPHGLIGQGYDGLLIEGKKDSYTADENGVFVTSAQGEGAIEGVVSDYFIDPKDPFSTVFKFSRFGKAKAAPRDVSQLKSRVA